MVELLGVVTAVVGITEKARNLYKGLRTDHHVKSEQLRKETESVLKEVAQLIEQFTESVDLIFHVLTEVNATPTDHIRNTLKLSQTNRRLWEISSDMRIVADSLSTKFKGVEISQLQELTDRALQIAYFDDLISVRMAQQSQLEFLPMEVSLEQITTNLNLDIFEMEELPSSTNVCGQLLPTLNYFNNLLLQLRKSKEALARALEDLHKE